MSDSDSLQSQAESEESSDNEGILNSHLLYSHINLRRLQTAIMRKNKPVKMVS